MAFRDDLENDLEDARAQAASAEQQLAKAKNQIDVDQQRIAELEAAVAAANQRADKAALAAKLHGALEGHRDSDDDRDRVRDRENRAYGFAIWLMLLLVGAGVAGWYATVRRSPSSRTPFTAPQPSLPSATSVSPTPDKEASDVFTELPGALALARKTYADAELFGIEATYVDEHAVSYPHYGGKVRFEFRSKALTAQPAPVAPRLGAPVVENRRGCRVDVEILRAHELHPHPSTAYSERDCSHPELPAVRCTVQDIWNRALADGAPHNALATVYLKHNENKLTWTFGITDAATHQTVFFKTYADDCK